MHIVLLPGQRSEVLQVEFNGRVFEVTFNGDGAHVPNDLGNHMLAQGLVAAGYSPNPKPRFERYGNTHGKELPMFEPWVKEVKPQI
jgi:hypothetical protein